MTVNFVDRVAEARIAAASDEGAFADLPGTGEPLPPDEALQVPVELRTAYRMLKNAGYVPPEVSCARDVHALRDLLSTLEPESAEAAATRRRLRWLEMTLANSRHGRGLLSDSRYGTRIKQALTDGD